MREDSEALTIFVAGELDGKNQAEFLDICTISETRPCCLPDGFNSIKASTIASSSSSRRLASNKMWIEWRVSAVELRPERLGEAVSMVAICSRSYQ